MKSLIVSVVVTTLFALSLNLAASGQVDIQKKIESRSDRCCVPASRQKPGGAGCPDPGCIVPTAACSGGVSEGYWGNGYCLPEEEKTCVYSFPNSFSKPRYSCSSEPCMTEDLEMGETCTWQYQDDNGGTQNNVADCTGSRC